MTDPNYPQYPSANDGDAYAAPQGSRYSAPNGQYQQGQYQQRAAQYGQGQAPYQPYPTYGQPGQQTAYQQGQYDQPQWRPTDGFSIAALVTSLLGFNVVAIVLGIIGLNRTKNGAMSGRGMAIAGIVIGSLWFVAIIVLMIFYFSLVAASYTW